MAIDPLLYEKVTGRSADPSVRLGKALAEQAKSRRPSHEGSPEGGVAFAGLKAHWWMSIIGSIVVLIVLLWAFAF